MDLQVNKKAVSLFLQIFNPQKPIEPTIKVAVEKPVFIEKEIKQPFERVRPEQVGVSSSDIMKFYNKLNENENLDMHGVLILKDGKIISEVSFGAYKQNIWHITHSECKSITGLAIGLLIDENKLKLEDRIVDIFEDECNAIEKISHRAIKVKDLLTMRSGVSFAEIGTLVEKKWSENFFESKPSLDVGKNFNYNSLNTYMLSAIVKKISGENMLDYLKRKLFFELGINNIFWEKSPEGIEKGGWGLYILPEDLAKIGQLILNKGLWNGKQLISKSWIEESTKIHVHTPEKMGSYSYGYQTWVGEHNNTFLFNGMFGQNLIGDFDTNLLVVINAGNNDVFQKSPVFKYYDEIFGKGKIEKKSISKNKKANSMLKKVEESLNEYPKVRNKTLIEKIIFEKKREEFFKKQNGIIWETDSKKSGMLSILPFCVQAIQNNFTKGMTELWFDTINKKKYIVIKETDEIYKIPFDFNKYEYTKLSFHGEEHVVGVTARAAQNEDGCPVLIIRLSFLEISNNRGIKIVFMNDEKIRLEFTENPGREVIINSISSIKKSISKKPLLSSIDIPLSEEIIEFLVDIITEPKIIAIRKK